MYQYRHILVRMRLGESDAALAELIEQYGQVSVITHMDPFEDRHKGTSVNSSPSITSV